MGSNMNFKTFGNEPPGDGSGSGRQPGSDHFALTRQSSIYSLTFDEFQSTLGGIGKDFGSMNMDELLKNIWSAEETQSMATAAAAVAAATSAAAASGSGPQDGGNQGGGYLQRQGSLTLPRTLSQKTVDEVWKDIAKEFDGGKDGGDGSSVPPRQTTLKEMTLEEFLLRAGVVREEGQNFGKTDAAASGIFGELARSSNNNSTGFGIDFQHAGRGVDLMGNHISENNHMINMQSTNLPLNVNGVRTSHQHATQAQLAQQPLQKPLQQHHQQQPLLFPKQPDVSYASALTLPGNEQLGGPGIRGGMVGLGDPGMKSSLIPNSALQGAGMGMVGLGGGAIGVPTGSPGTLSSDGLAKSNGDTSSVSPVPYVFNGGFRGRKPGTVDKVVERRQRRMIKNRESAARSRARKQAYTMELEQEVAKLKEENQELRKKQAEIMEMQKSQAQEMMNAESGPRKRLRRTQTGPW